VLGSLLTHVRLVRQPFIGPYDATFLKVLYKFLYNMYRYTQEPYVYTVSQKKLCEIVSVRTLSNVHQL